MKKITTPLMFCLVAAAVFMASNAWALFGFFEGGSGQVSPQNGAISIPVADVDDGQAHYFSYDDNGKTIKFFVLKSRDGVIRAAFDACDVCFREKKGYRQDGDFMICNNCGQKFHSTRINEVKGGCNPAPLARVKKDGLVVITEADIRQGGYLF